jgi:hypothetical protein
LGLLDETRQRLNEEKEEKTREKQREADDISRELRYSQQVVAGELAGWQDMHEKMGRRSIKEFARGMIILERGRLDGMRRALRKLKEVSSGTETQLDAGTPVVEVAVDELEARRQMENGTSANADTENGVDPTSSGGESSAMGAASNAAA